MPLTGKHGGLIMKKILYATMSAAALILSNIKLSADDSGYFVFLADNTKLLAPTQVIAPDSSNEKEYLDVAFLMRINNGVVQDVEEIGARARASTKLKELLKLWKFDKHASGQFLLLHRAGQKLPLIIFPHDLLDNKPLPTVKALPSYPRLRRSLISCKVTLEIIVSENGTPVTATILSSTSPDYNDNAYLAALLYRFQIGKKDGKPVAYKTKIDVCFDVTL